MFKKLFIAVFIVLLSAGSAGLSQMGRISMALVSAWDNKQAGSLAKSWPINDAEEADKDASGSSESSEDDEYVSFKWASLFLSGNSDISEHEASDLFKSIEREILVPPPRA
jgi:hypothetical protein